MSSLNLKATPISGWGQQPIGMATSGRHNDGMAQSVAERQRAFKASMKAAGYVKLEAWVTLEQREKFRQLGGDEWLRKKIEAAKPPDKR